MPSRFVRGRRSAGAHAVSCTGRACRTARLTATGRADVRITGPGDRFLVRARHNDEARVGDGASPWDRPCLQPVGARPQHAVPDVPAEDHPVHPRPSCNAEACDSLAGGRDLEDHELDERGPGQHEHERCLPQPLRPGLRNPVAGEVQSVDLPRPRGGASTLRAGARGRSAGAESGLRRGRRRRTSSAGRRRGASSAARQRGMRDRRGSRQLRHRRRNLRSRGRRGR